jgi:hypothetical protein
MKFKDGILTVDVATSFTLYPAMSIEFTKDACRDVMENVRVKVCVCVYV